LVLASKSPQRRAILEQLGVPVIARPSNVEERSDGAPEEVVTGNALRKASATSDEDAETVLGVDTVVVLDGEVIGKPRDQSEARAHLERLAGRTHEVWSGVAILGPGGERVAAARTTVTFRARDDRLLDWYLGGGEWRERAGSYAIQGRGAALVEGIEGDYWNVVGLPVPLLVRLAPELLLGHHVG
jgi:septum formation protein